MCTRAISLLVLLVGLSYCFSMDIVEGEEKRLHFYKNGKLTHTEYIPSIKVISSVTYDPVQYRVLFGDYNNVNNSVSRFDLSTRTIQPLVTSKRSHFISGIAYDPVTQLLFWLEVGKYIYSYSLDPALSNKAVDGNLLITTNNICYDIAVDSCGGCVTNDIKYKTAAKLAAHKKYRKSCLWATAGYIYWITAYEIERARFDGSEREVLIDSTVWLRLGLAIDQQTQKMYWVEKMNISDKKMSIQSADLKGKNKTTLYIIKNETFANSLTVSKDFIYWRGKDQKGIFQLPKNAPQQRVEAKLFSISHSEFKWYSQSIVANYTIKEQIGKNQNCEDIKSLIPNYSLPDVRVSVLCVHGTIVSAESRCECTQGYTGESCDVYICQNYCLQGDCSVSAEGQPKCSCKEGYSGERCEVNACHKHCLNSGVCSLNNQQQPVCQCTADYGGARCDVSICKDYCLQGNCSINAEGQPKCSCTDVYSGERCEVNACLEYCSNNGVCSVNEEDEPVCECTADYEGARCDVPTCKDNCDSDERQTKNRCIAGNSGEGQVNACHHYCLNNGVCSLNEENDPVCQCTGDYEGERCDVPAFLIKCFLYAYKYTDACDSEQRSEVDVCFKRCLKNGASLARANRCSR